MVQMSFIFTPWGMYSCDKSSLISFSSSDYDDESRLSGGIDIGISSL